MDLRVEDFDLDLSVEDLNLDLDSDYKSGLNLITFYGNHIPTKFQSMS